MRRAVLILVAVALIWVPTGLAKMVPTLGKHLARPGERIHASLGMGARYFAWPSRIEVSLVRTDAARLVVNRQDRRLVHVATLRSDGGFVSNRFAFVVPRLSAGDYTLAVWLREKQTGSWQNAVAFAYSYAQLSRRMALRVAGG